MLGDSSSVLATTTTASGSRVGGGEVAAEAPPPPPSASHLEAAAGGHHVVGSNNNTNNNNSSDQERGGAGGAADEGDRSFGGNRWPREETLALLRIRSDMDVAFRDASVKGPLWEEVSRKLAELGYNRSAKKCKEKFENVYKYHKRTKEGRTGKHEGKTYRFFDQLEAFESHPPPSFPPPPKPQPPSIVSTLPMPPMPNPPPPPPPSHIIATSTTATVPSKNVVDQGINLTVPPPFSISSTNPISTTVLQQEKNPTVNVSSSVMPSFSGDLVSNSTSSSSTSSDVEIQGRRKRKWKDFFEGLMKEVIHRQEDMQKRFLETIEKREHERMVREESWRMQEMARINREREILAQERSMASAKDAAVMAFLQKISEQQNPGNQLQQQVVQQNQPQPQIQPIQAPPPPPPPSQPAQVSAPTPAPAPAAAPAPLVVPQPAQAVPAQQQQQQQQQAVSTPPPARGQEMRNVEMKTDNNGDQLMSGASSSRWPKVEVEALIHLRTNLDSKYQENGPKGPLWEEISAGMRKLGYNRNAKRCKEKWENINKYFKKVKESNKKRPEDSKTCPYFHQLDALYREKNATHVQFKPENSVPLMVRPEQQWPPPPPPPPPPSSSSHHPPPDSAMDDLESDQDHDDKDNDDDEDDDEAGGYEIVPNRQTSISSAG